MFEMPLHSRKVRAGDLVFVCSLSDVFHPEVPEDWLWELFDVMDERKDVTFLLLTKRPRRMRDWVELLEREWGWIEKWRHVWIGVTAETQRRATERIPELLAIDWPGTRFVSIEPMLEAVTLRRLAKPVTGPGSSTPAAPPTWWVNDCLSGFAGSEDWHGRGAGRQGRRLDWVIVGGESGPGCRPMALEWARDVRDQCRAAEVPFFMKQLGGWPDKREQLEDLPEDLRVRETPEHSS
jgi:protein gp37